MASFSGKSLVVVTGASRGIGKEIAVEVAKRCKGEAVFVLTARSETKLKETREEILKVDGGFTVDVVPLDLCRVHKQDFDMLIKNLLALGPFDCAYLFHNAGSTGLLKKTLNLDDSDYWHEYMHSNYFSAVFLTSAFVRKLKPVSSKITIINITSLAAREPFENLAMYGSGKAARELYFRVLAKEEPDLLVLNYSPGPVDTDMFNGIISNAESEEVRKQFADVKEKKVVLTVQKTVEKLLGLLEEGDFESGTTIDYYDRF